MKIFKKSRMALMASVALTTMAFATPAWAEIDAKAVVSTYADIALATYQDSLTSAEALKVAIDALIASPSDATMAAARAAWIAARIPYQQTEAFRFGNPIVDAWEGRVNAWPLDEGLIDYVDNSYGTESDENNLYRANVIANSSLMIGGKEINATIISPEFLADTLHEAGEVESNVATGYHAIEFLLWGQDLNGTNAGAGNRSWTDFSKDDCTNGNCDRRADYLSAATSLLITDIKEMIGNWEAEGEARAILFENDGRTGLSAILTGMGSLSYGEMAGERMKLGLLLHDPEEEHDCFSDNTQASHLNDAMGIRTVYQGRYVRIDGTVIEGPSVSDLVKEADASLDAELSGKLTFTVEQMGTLVTRAAGGEAYDQMISEGNTDGNAAVQAAIDALVDQTRSIERVVATLSLDRIEFEGSDSLDSPNAVFK